MLPGGFFPPAGFVLDRHNTIDVVIDQVNFGFDCDLPAAEWFRDFHPLERALARRTSSNSQKFKGDFVICSIFTNDFL